MKKLFSIKCDEGYIFYHEETEVFSVVGGEKSKYRNRIKKWIDCTGKEVDPPDIEYYDNEDDEEEELPIPPYRMGCVPEESEDNWLHPYTTKEYTEDMYGLYGCFGIKNRDDEIIVEEQYYQIGRYANGLCPVRYKETKWGCIDRTGKVVLPFQYCDPPEFNKYGIAYGDERLIDMQGNELEGTESNCWEYYEWDTRYFVICLLNEEQMKLVDECGIAPNVTVDIYDTKERKFVVRNIPELTLDVEDTDAENDVIAAAASMIDKYENIKVRGKSIIICRNDKEYDVYDYYK